MRRGLRADLSYYGDHPSIFDLLLGRHAYGMGPETETAWCRVFLLWGFINGMFFSGLLQGLFR